MQTARAFRLVEAVPGRERPRARTRGDHSITPKPARSGQTTRKPRRGSRGWLKPLIMAILIAGEWLLVIADVFTRFYLAC
jgi:hypothetical protein